MVRHPRGSYTWYPHCYLCKWPHRKMNQLIEAVCHPQASPRHTRFLVGCSSSCVRLAGHLTFRFALGASNVCALVGEKPKVSPSRHRMMGMRRSMVIRLRPCMISRVHRNLQYRTVDLAVLCYQLQWLSQGERNTPTRLERRRPQSPNRCQKPLVRLKKKKKTEP